MPAVPIYYLAYLQPSVKMEVLPITYCDDFFSICVLNSHILIFIYLIFGHLFSSMISSPFLFSTCQSIGNKFIDNFCIITFSKLQYQRLVFGNSHEMMNEIFSRILGQDDMVSLQFLKLIRDSLTILLLIATRFGRF